MKIVYYTSSHFLDIVLENISRIKYHCEVYLFIEINPFSKCATIIDLTGYQNNRFIENATDVLIKTNQSYLLPYFAHLKEAKFVFFSAKQSLSHKNYKEALVLRNYIKHINTDIIHYDTISSRAFALLGLHKRKKIIITLHDAIPHPGEDSWKEHLTNYLFYKGASQFVFHSEYVRKMFASKYPKQENQSLLQLLPYTTYTNLKTENLLPTPQKYMLFYGRISYYKGVDLLIEAFKRITHEFPDWTLVIAGKEVYGYQLYKNFSFPESINIINEYVSPKQLADYINKSSLVVCPYREASQSGVLMTAMAFKKPVLATRVGSFEEFITDGLNGFLCEATATSIENKLRDILQHRQDLTVKKYLNKIDADNLYEDNLKKQKKLYGIG